MSIVQPTTTETSEQLPLWRQIRWTLVFAFVLMSVIPALIVAVISISRAVDQAESQILDELLAVAELKHASVDRWLIDSQSTLEQLIVSSETPRLVDLAYRDQESDAYATELEYFQEIFHNSLDAQILLSEIFVYTPQGDLFISSNPDNIGKVVLNQPYFQGSLVGKAYEHEVLDAEFEGHIDYIQPIYVDSDTGELTMMLTHGVVDEVTGQLSVIIAGRPNLKILNELMLERAGLGETGETYLVGQENNYLLTESRFLDAAGQLHEHTSVGITDGLAGNNSFGQYDDYRGVPVFGVYRWVPELEAALLAEQDTAEALLSATTTRNFTMVITAVTILLAITFGLLISNYIANPITELTSVAAKIEKGDFGQRVNISQTNEVGLLARAFNSMTQQLQEFIGSLEARVADRTRALEISADVSRSLSTILDTDELTQAVVTRVNDAFDYYHSQIYLWNDDKNRLVMVGGTGESGKQMLAAGHGIDPGKGLVGKAAEANMPVLVSDVTQDSSWLPNPLLPDTKSEAAVPIALGSQVLGVLDVQHNVANGLQQQDVDMLQSIANQVAVALQNTRLYADTQAHADQEAMINEINQKILQTTDMESAMKVAIRELGRAVGAPQTAVRLKSKNGSNGHNN